MASADPIPQPSVMAHPAGPAPTPEPTFLGPARRRVLAALAAVDSQGLTVTALSRQLGGHSNAARHHLTALVAAGLADGSAERGEGRGRPARVYRPTAAGHRALGGPDAVVGRHLVAALVSVAAPHPELVREAGRRWGKRLSGQVPVPAEDAVRTELARIMTGQGFAAVDSGDADVDAVDAGKGGQVIELLTCPLLDQARQDPASVCTLHASMLQGVVQSWGSEADVVLEPFALSHGCRVTVRPARPHHREDASGS